MMHGQQNIKITVSISLQAVLSVHTYFKFLFRTTTFTAISMQENAFSCHTADRYKSFSFGTTIS
jgi:hypothetical protein